MVPGGWNLALSSQSQNKKKAWCLIDYLTSKQTLQNREYIFETESGCIQIRAPANREVLRDIRGDGDALDYCFKYLDGRHYRTRTKVGCYGDYSRILAEHIHRFLSSDIQPEQVRHQALETSIKIQQAINQL